MARNELGDKCFADTMKVELLSKEDGQSIQNCNKDKKVRLFAEVDGVSFDSFDYDNHKKWLQDIVDRVHACSMGELN